MKRLRIRAPSQLTAPNCEKLLFDYYVKSNDAADITFDLTGLRWCDISSVSILAMWIRDLIVRGARVTCKLPTDYRQLSFLQGYRFLSAIDGAVLDSPTRSEPAESPLPPLGTRPTYPLTFIDEVGFRLLLDSLAAEGGLAGDASKSDSSALIKSGMIRDVVLWELGDNAFRHGGGSQANVVMTQYHPRSNISAAHWRRFVGLIAFKPELAFYERLAGRPFLSLIVADKGLSIPLHIRKGYDDDRVLASRSKAPSEAELIDYAFEEHSTGRTLEERHGALRQAISGENIPPSTGLFKLRETVREYSGLLTVRSGATIVVYDCGSKNPVRPLSLESLAFGRLAPFGGTQVRAVFPIEAKGRQTIPVPSFRDRTFEAPPSYRYLALADDVKNVRTGNLDQEADALLRIFDKVSSVHRQTEPRGALILDFEGCDTVLSPKALDYLLVGLTHRQSEHRANIPINLSADPGIATRSWRSHVSSISRSVLGYTKEFRPFVIPSSEDQQRFIEDSLSGPVRVDDWSPLARRETSHLLRPASRPGFLELIHCGAAFIDALEAAFRQRLADMLIDVERGLWHERVRVLIPSGRYCEGFLETYRLATDHSLLSTMRNWVETVIRKHRPDVILVITEWFGALVRDFVSQGEGDGPRPQVHVIPAPIQQLNVMQVGLRVRPHAGVVVFTDAIATGASLFELVRHLNHASRVDIYSLFDGLQGREVLFVNDRTYHVRAAASRALTYHADFPADWRYEEVHQVDPATHALILPRPSTDVLLLDKFMPAEGDLLADVLAPSGAVQEVHFSSLHGHSSYYFSLDRLLDDSEALIASLIADDISQKRRDVKRPIRYCLYPAAGPLEKLATFLCRQFPPCIGLEVSEQEMARGRSSVRALPDHAAIVITAAAETGSTLLRLCDVAATLGAKDILAFAILKRGSDPELRLVRGIDVYRGAHIQLRFVADVGIPAYSPRSCPLCQWVAEVDRALDNPEITTRMTRALRQERWRYAERFADTLRRETHAGPKARTDDDVIDRARLRRQVALAKDEPRARNELARMVRAYATDSDRVLRFLEVLARERMLLLHDAELRTAVFYGTFAEALREACKEMVRRLARLTPSQADGVIATLCGLDQSYLLEHLGDLLEASRRSEQACERVLMHCELSRAAMDAPAVIHESIKSALAAFGQGKPGATSAVRRLLEEAASSWGTRNLGFSKGAHDQVRWYRELVLGAFHDVGKHLDELRRLIDSEPSSSRDQLTREWLALKHELGHDLDLLRSLRNSSVRFTNRQALGQAIGSLSLQLEAGQSVIERRSASPKLFDEIEGGLDPIVARIDELIFGHAGLVELLQHLSSNVKSVIHRVLAQQKEKLAGFILTFDTPDSLPLVFAEDVFLTTVVVNLLDNIAQHSKGTTLRVELLDMDLTHEVVVLVCDNGLGLRGRERGKGLRNVDAIIRSYGGRLELDGAQSSTAPNMEVAVKVVLPSIPPVRVKRS